MIVQAFFEQISLFLTHDKVGGKLWMEEHFPSVTLYNVSILQIFIKCKTSCMELHDTWEEELNTSAELQRFTFAVIKA